MNDLLKVVLIALACPLMLPIAIEESEVQNEDSN